MLHGEMRGEGQVEGRHDVITGGSSHLFISSVEKLRVIFLSYMEIIRAGGQGESCLDVNNRRATFMSYTEKIRGGG